MEQRKPVHQGVLGRPLPCLGQRVDVGGDGAPAHHDTLRRSRGAGGVHDQRGGLRRRFGIAMPRARVQPHRDVRQALVGLSGRSPSHACAPESVRMCRRSAAPTSAGTGTTGTPAIRQPVTASTVVAVGVASTATRCAPPTRSATDVAAPTRSLRLSTAPSMRTASPMSAPVGDGRGVQRGQQHASEATRTGVGILGAWMRSSASRPARCTGTTG